MRACSWTTAAALAAWIGPASAQVGGPLFGGGPPPPERSAPLDPRIPEGRRVVVHERPKQVMAPACSFRRPVCVHVGPGVQPKVASDWLGALEDSWDRIVWSLGAPPPLSDFDKGGSPALDLYLEAGDAPLRAVGDPTFAWRRDVTSTFCRAGVDGAEPRRGAALCIGEGVANRLDAAEPDAARAALAEHLWLSVGEPAPADVARVDDAQAHPERALLSTEGSAAAQVLLYEHLDRAGQGAPSGIALSMHALALGPASPPGLRLSNEPDVLDVFRATFGRKPTELGRAVMDFALFRALLGRRAAAGEPFGIDPTSRACRVRFDWRVPLSSLPRHLAVREPVGPFGSTYVWLDLDEPTEGVTLALVAEWEGPVAFAWSLASLDAEGRLVRRIDVPYDERARRAERTLVDLQGARAVIVAGANVGAISPSYPFDPDYGPHEPHAASVYLAKLGTPKQPTP